MRPQLSGSFEGGSFGAMRGDARLHGGARVLDYHFGASRRDTDGAFQDLLPEDDEFSQEAVDGGVGVVLGSRGTLRANLRYTTAEGRSVGQIAYGSRDTGTTYETKDFSGMVDFTHALGSRFVGSATYNDFRYKSRSADTIADPAVFTYAILTGTPNALFPNGTRLVRLIEAAEFNSIVAAGAMPAPGQFVASRQGSDFLSNPLLAYTRVHPAGVSLPGRLQSRLGAAHRRLRMGARRRARQQRTSASTTRPRSCSITPRSAIAGLPPPADASTARTPTTRSSAPSCRPAASWCRTVAARCRR